MHGGVKGGAGGVKIVKRETSGTRPLDASSAVLLGVITWMAVAFRCNPLTN